MSSDNTLANLASIWQQQPVSGFRMVPSEFARKIRADNRSSKVWLRINLAIFTFEVVWFGAILFRESDPFRRAGSLLAVMAMMVFVAQVAVHMRRLRAVRFDVDRTTAPATTSARGYLQTRHEFHSGLWLWSRVIVLIPGPPLLFYGFGRTEGEMMPIVFPTVLFLWVVVLGAIVFFVQRPTARGYERQLRELDDIERYSPVERFIAAHEQWK